MNLNDKPFPADNKLCMLIRTQADHRPLVSFLQKELDSKGLMSATYDVSIVAERAVKLPDKLIKEIAFGEEIVLAVTVIGLD